MVGQDCSSPLLHRSSIHSNKSHSKMIRNVVNEVETTQLS